MLDGSAVESVQGASGVAARCAPWCSRTRWAAPAKPAGEYARAIQASGVNTEAHGQCHAACAYAFLAGKEHRFGRGFR